MYARTESDLLAPQPADWPEPEQLGFGQYLGPYLIESSHLQESGWSAPCISPRSAAQVAVASGAVQYGLSVFEGLKAYRAPDNRIHLFRPHDHARRLQASARRLCLPEPPESLCLSLCRLAVEVHATLVPPHGRGSLYLRPTLFADQEGLGLKEATKHRLSIAVTACADPVPKALRLWAEPELIRAAPGGLGAAKTGGNYAAGMAGLMRAKARGYDDVAWLDAHTHTQLSEAGTMNLFVQIGADIVTPPLDGTILPGITRDSVIQLLSDQGVRVLEQAIDLDALRIAQSAGALGTAFGSGTACRLARIASIGDSQREITFADNGLVEEWSQHLKRIQEGALDGRADWRLPL